MTLQRVTRNRRLAPDEAARYREVREQVAKELPELIARSMRETCLEVTFRHGRAIAA